MGKSKNSQHAVATTTMPLERALSARGRLWQSWRWAWRWGGGMLAALALPLTAPAQATGPVGTLARGTYACELPGDALGKSGIRQPQEDFTILAASLYSAPQGRGTYLANGDHITMTSGPRKGDAYRRESENFLRKLTRDGHESVLRCIRKMMNNND